MGPEQDLGHHLASRASYAARSCSLITRRSQLRVAKSRSDWQIRSVLREPLHVMLRELAAFRSLSPDNVAAEAALGSIHGS